MTRTDDTLAPELELVAALRMTASPPRAWIEAAWLLPSTLGDLHEVEQLLTRPGFRDAFVHDPERTLADAGLPASPPVLVAVRERLAAA